MISVVHILNGRETSNLFYYKETVAALIDTETVGNALSTEFFDHIYAPLWQPHFTSRQTLSAIWVVRVWPTIGTPWATPFVDEVGGVGGDSCPNNAAALLSFVSKINSRNYQRRCYFSGIPESRQVGAEINVVQIFALGLLGDGIISEVLQTPLDPPARWAACAFSKKLAAAADPDPSSLLTGRGVTTAIRSQRQRNLFTWTKGI
jgi:hypothetical protein